MAGQRGDVNSTDHPYITLQQRCCNAFGGKEQIIQRLAPFLAAVFFLAGWEDGKEHMKYLC